MIVAALLLCVMGIRIIVLATCKRASLSLARTVKKFVELSKIHNGTKRIYKHSEEEFFIKPEDPNDNDNESGVQTKRSQQKRAYVDEEHLSRLYSFPGNSKGCYTSHFHRVINTTCSPFPSLFLFHVIHFRLFSCLWW